MQRKKKRSAATCWTLVVKNRIGEMYQMRRQEKLKEKHKFHSMKEDKSLRKSKVEWETVVEEYKLLEKHAVESSEETETEKEKEKEKESKVLKKHE